MKIKKYKKLEWFSYYYDTKTHERIWHGLNNDPFFGVGYRYHNQLKGFWLLQ